MSVNNESALLIRLTHVDLIATQIIEWSESV